MNGIPKKHEHGETTGRLSPSNGHSSVQTPTSDTGGIRPNLRLDKSNDQQPTSPSKLYRYGAASVRTIYPLCTRFVHLIHRSLRNENTTVHKKTNPTTNTNASINSGDPISKRIRRLLEPLIMSLITVLLLFHWQFGTTDGISSLYTEEALLDAPFFLPPVKRRFADPPAYDYHSKLPKSKDTSSVPIFFHIYIPDESSKRTKALRIVTSQLDKLTKERNTAPQLTTKDPVTIFYQTIGTADKHTLSSGVIQSLCKERKLKCRHLGHYPEGREELTLHHVQQFCKADVLHNTHSTSNTTRRVMYIHNKGSHHPSTINDRWRSKMMAAMTHEKCLKPPMETCTLCSLFLTAERGIFVAGNFWIARCDYITKLLPPLEFEGHQERVVKNALYLNLESKLNMNMHKHWPPSFGTGRFAAEHWAGSHPDVVPCDFSMTFKPRVQNADNTLDFLTWVNDTKTTSKKAPPLRWTMAPKHKIKIPQKDIRNNEVLRLQEYFLLPGNILRWYDLYGRVPGEFSWVWAWFPDGRKWRNAIRQHGKQAVLEMTKGLEKEGYT